MNRRAGCVAWMVVAGWLAAVPAASGQVIVEPTAQPTVTADREPWYLNGEPISYAGNLYYPTGAQVYFNATEMVRSGFFMGVPLYARTTIEPYSVVYVPLDGGRLQPYQRPRTGELTGTAGSVPSTLPHPRATVPPRGLAAQAAGPPSQTTIEIPVQIPRPYVILPTPPPLTEVAGTAGRIAQPQPPLRVGGAVPRRQAIFIDYEGRRWYASGPPRRLEATGLVRLPDYHGFEVWAKSQDPAEIQIPVTHGSDMAVTYVARPPGKPVR